MFHEFNIKVFIIANKPKAVIADKKQVNPRRKKMVPCLLISNDARISKLMPDISIAVGPQRKKPVLQE